MSLFFFLHISSEPEKGESRLGTGNPNSRLEKADRLLSISRTDRYHAWVKTCMQKEVLTYRERAATPQQWREAPAACRLSPLSACPSAAADPEAEGPRTTGGGRKTWQVRCWKNLRQVDQCENNKRTMNKRLKKGVEIKRLPLNLSVFCVVQPLTNLHATIMKQPNITHWRGLS